MIQFIYINVLKLYARKYPRKRSKYPRAAVKYPRKRSKYPRAAVKYPRIPSNIRIPASRTFQSLHVFVELI
ncbi:hypothetical protein [Lysinibacillus sp. NPDC056232]|uniref:hypothetical protein n=1 Tax=Lysinibacillus sp. NPDC056232 TaxID=3345756 RepID=UPI0035D69F45